MNKPSQTLNGVPTTEIECYHALPHNLQQVISGISRIPSGEFVLPWHGLSIRSVFQPIVSFTHSRVIGHEALARATNSTGDSMSPVQLFAESVARGDLSLLDRACRVVHMANAGQLPGSLFLNLHPQLFDDKTGKAESKKCLEYLINAFNFDLSRLVIEIVEDASNKESRFVEYAQGLKEFGLMLAVDDFGSKASNFDRLLSINPDIVKLDRAFLCLDGGSSKVQRVLPKLVALLHENGSKVLLEGIETEQQALLALDANVDFGQGWYFGRPSPNPLQESTASENTLSGLWRKYESHIILQEENEVAYQEMVFDRLIAVARQLERGKSLREFAHIFLDLDDAKRIFILGKNGMFTSQPLLASCRCRKGDVCIHCGDKCPMPTTNRLMPLGEEPTSWENVRLLSRPFFRKAWKYGGSPKMTKPFVSQKDGLSTVTASMRVTVNGEHYVLCGDLHCSSIIMREFDFDALPTDGGRRTSPPRLASSVLT